MSTIYKYHLDATGDEDGRFVADIPLPGHVRPLRVGRQGERAYVWAIVDPDGPQEVHRFRVYGTGRRLEDERGDYIGTFESGLYVWHVFWEGPTDG